MAHDNRLRAAQNIMITGGSTMIPGFKKRLIQEIKALIQSNDEFEPLRSILQWIKVPELIYAPNICAWVGASILMSLGTDVDRFLLTQE
jgi:actin-related protein 10